MAETIGFIGLGSMGLPMAQRLLEAGYRLRVYNRTPAKAAPLLERGAEQADSPAAAAAPGGVVISMLADDDAVEQVAGGETGVVAGLGAGGVHLSMSTVSPEAARRLAVRHEREGVGYVAGPVFGRPDAAAAGRLWVVLAGTDEGKSRVQPLLEVLGQGVYDYGADPGAANIVKLAGNFLIASAMEAMAEAFTLAEKSGLDRGRLAQMLGETLFDCPVYRNYGRAIAEQRYEPAGFTAELGLKDVRLAQRMADVVHAPMPFAGVLHDRLLSLIAQGRGDIDWSGVGLGVAQGAGTR